MADQKEFKRRLKVLMSKQENLTCVDCNEKQPRWASLIKPPPGSKDPMGMGALMCLECSGSHRRLGVHISFVRSVNLDSWKEHEVQIMENGGNAKVNALFEAHLKRSGIPKPDNSSNGQQRERFIRDKYERRKFYDPSGLDDYVADEDEEEEVVKPARRSVSAPHSVAVSRAPSEAARRRAEARQGRLAAGGTAVPSDRPVRIGAVAAAPVSAPVQTVDLLDFGSIPSPPTAPPPAAPAPPPPQPNETMDLFANMTVSTSSAPVQPATKSNEDILSLFASNTSAMSNPINTGSTMQPAQGHVMMGTQQPYAPMTMMGYQQANGPMMMLGNQQAHNSMTSSHQQLNGQMMSFPMNQQMTQQSQAMMMQQQGHSSHVHGFTHPSMMMNNNMSAQQHMNPMMMQQASMQGMMINNTGAMPAMQHSMQHNNSMMGVPTVPIQQQVSEGGFGMGAPMGSGPSISTLQGQPQKEDPFAQFGFNAFR